MFHVAVVDCMTGASYCNAAIFLGGAAVSHEATGKDLYVDMLLVWSPVQETLFYKVCTDALWDCLGELVDNLQLQCFTSIKHQNKK